jgi:hypothetical protein
MTDTQFAVIVGTIWIAPHSNKWYAVVVGCGFVLAAAVKGLGWL